MRRCKGQARRSAVRFYGGRGLALLLCAAAIAAGLGSPASARPTRHGGDQQSTGSLVLRVAGLPRAERASITLTGPSGAPRGLRVKRVITHVGTVRIRHLGVGAYRLRIRKVKLRHRTGRIRKGAVAKPLRTRLVVRVKKHRVKRLTVGYGTIVNPGLRSVGRGVAKVFGDPRSPTAVKLNRRARRGTILSAAPSAKLPQGLLAHVTSVRRVRGGSIAHLRPAGIYEVAPNIQFRVPVQLSDGATSSAGLPCQVNGGSVGIHPYVRISDAWVSGGWTTTHVAFWDVKTGANADLHFRTAAGVEIKADAGLSCSLPLPSIGFQGLAGPIPVYGAIRPGTEAQVSGGAKMTAEGSTNVTLGAGIGGVPPSASPHFSFDSPRFDFKSEVFASASAAISLNAEMGIGVANAANLHVALGNSLSFNAAPGDCSWDLDLGTFSAGGQLGPLSISTPSSPPLYHRNLWHEACSPPPPPPAPAPTPAPPTVSFPLVRATMSWGTESDIDLYSWDQEGRLISYFERYGIPEAELVEDVIPAFGEISHAPEIFQEVGSPNRTYTFGICVYRGDGGDVTLDVADPDGGHRSFERSFYAAGESAVVTTSPSGTGFDPGSDWCSYYEEEEEEEEYEYEEEF
jgi:hypothetical protein